MKLPLLLSALLALPLVPAAAQADEVLQRNVLQVLAEAGPGTRWGLVVADDAGVEIVSIDPDGRYVPASNTKMFTTAAAFWRLPGINQPDRAGGTAVSLHRFKGGSTDVLLLGRGDARLSSAPDCKVDCLATLADAIAAKTHTVRDVIGDDTTFADQRWSPGMSWNNIPSNDGTGVSALTLDDNELVLTITPGPVPGGPALVSGPGYYAIDNATHTVPGLPTDEPVRRSPSPRNLTGQTAAEGDLALGYARMPGSRMLRISGTVNTGSPPARLVLGIDDPADYAAWRLAEMLRDRKVKVTGRALAAHATSDRKPLAADTAMAVDSTIAPTVPTPIADDIAIINKVSQNLHAEVLVRRIGKEDGAPSLERGIGVIGAMLTRAGLTPHQFTFADGSGMSTYNRVAPRGVVRFLRWTQTLPWGPQFRTSFPIGGVDGTLAYRFRGTPLAGKIFAKTGTLNATNAIAGWLTAASGKTLTFAFYANDVPDDVRATPLMDRALQEIAAAN